MSVADAELSRDARYWLIPLVRAVIALGVAVAITFSADHSAPVGFLAFGAFALLSGLAIALLAARVTRPSVERSFSIAQGAVGVAVGVASFALTTSGTAVLLFIVSAWAAITGFFELYLGIRSRGRLAQSRDWVFVGALTAVFAVVVLLIPSGFEQAFTGPDEVERVLTASVVLVGIIGAYAAIVGVYLAIAGLSLKWAARPSSESAVR